MYRQVKLAKGNARMTTWIPETFAQQGRLLKLKTKVCLAGTHQPGYEVEEWNDGWVVEEVYGRMEGKELQERSRDYLHQREASDI